MTLIVGQTRKPGIFIISKPFKYFNSRFAVIKYVFQKGDSGISIKMEEMELF